MVAAWTRTRCAGNRLRAQAALALPPVRAGGRADHGLGAENGLKAGDKLPPERELAVSLGVSRATVRQALVALEVIGVVAVRHGDGAVLADASGSAKVLDAIRAHARRIPDVIDARDALETKIAALAAARRTGDDLARIDDALEVMGQDIEKGGRGLDGDELFHAAVTAAAHSSLLAGMMAEISDLILETRIESLGQPGRPRTPWSRTADRRRHPRQRRPRSGRGHARPRRDGQRRGAAARLTWDQLEQLIVVGGRARRRHRVRRSASRR